MLAVGATAACHGLHCEWSCPCKQIFSGHIHINRALEIMPHLHTLQHIDFHIVVEDGDGDKVLHHERFHLRKGTSSAHVRVFNVPFDPLPPQYFIRVICDRWMHSSVTVPVIFRNQMYSLLNPPPTALLDLRLSSLGKGGGETLMLGMRHYCRLHTHHGGCLNAVQTSLPVLYETDECSTLCTSRNKKVGLLSSRTRLLDLGKKTAILTT